ncbi:Phosphoenolpyruvate/phosphate translocator 2, chloroplastic [Gracilariopsis chorda]|uniref:Phosphoenolpyruvate/phosphate translocator 2, chloroplastic n=1 Tax=Gracilariopsis chorda TaxID=448386 RepID=A0A2V3IKL4_9FLOR|nr:Phosphoenolpyruvate/phosphate translocator 2, chloroplastic [Gracilariopsis chorda]|eukprot:PXF42622.1 Phosphoenolpyruvate/phosphate translocator 2, chloroplastic [Gracilariopsis chorda]
MPSPARRLFDSSSLSQSSTLTRLHSFLPRVKVALFISGWFTFSLASLFFAKHVLNVYEINEAIFTLWQFASSVLFGLLFTKVLRIRPLAVLTRAQMRAVVPLSAAFLVKEVLKYASLARVSVNLVNTIRSLGPLFNVLLELLFFGHRPPISVVWALFPIILGVALTSVDEIHSASVSSAELLVAIIGFTAAVLSTAINNAQNIYSKVLFGKERIDPVSLQIYLSAISLAIMSPGSLAQLAYHVVAHDLPAHKFLAPSWPVAAGLALAGFVNFAASQLAFNTLNLISPLSYSVANTFKRVCIAVIAIFYFNERLSVVNGVGIIISIVGVFIYERKSRALKEAKMYRKSGADSRSSSLPSRKQNASGPDLVNMALDLSSPRAEVRKDSNSLPHYGELSLTPSAAARAHHAHQANTNSRA